MVFFEINWYQSFTAQFGKTPNSMMGSGSAGISRGAKMFYWKLSILLFNFLQDLWRQSHHKVLFPRTFSEALQAPGLRELPLGFICCGFNLHSLLSLRFSASALLLCHNDPEVQIDSLNFAETTQTVSQEICVFINKEKWIPPFKHVSQKPLNDFYKAQTIGKSKKRVGDK